VHGIGGDRARYEPVRSVITPSLGDAQSLAQAYVAVLGTSEIYVADLDAIEGGPAQYGMHSAAAVGQHRAGLFLLSPPKPLFLDRPALLGSVGYTLVRETPVTEVLPWRVLEFERP